MTGFGHISSTISIFLWITRQLQTTRKKSYHAIIFMYKNKNLSPIKQKNETFLIKIIY